MLPSNFEKNKYFHILLRKGCFWGKKSPSTSFRACPEEFEGMKEDRRKQVKSQKVTGKSAGNT